MDLDVVCTDPQQQSAMLAMSIPVLVLVSLGIPVASAAFLRRIGPQELQEPVWRNLLGFLVNGYRTNLYFWESVVLLRKVFLACVTTTLAPAGPGMQITTALIVILVALVLHARFHPYATGVINALESFALVTAALTLVGGVYVVLDVSNDAGTASGVAAPAASAMIAVVNIVFLLSALALLSRRVRDWTSSIYQRATSSMRRAAGGSSHGADDEDEDSGWVERLSVQSQRALRRAARRNTISPTRGPKLATPLKQLDVSESPSFSQENPLRV
jgi:hypothetical protein